MKTRKLRKLMAHYQQTKIDVGSLRTELQDTIHEFQRERADMFLSLRSLDQQLQLKAFIIEVSSMLWDWHAPTHLSLEYLERGIHYWPWVILGQGELNALCHLFSEFPPHIFKEVHDRPLLAWKDINPSCSQGLNSAKVSRELHYEVLLNSFDWIVLAVCWKWHDV